MVTFHLEATRHPHRVLQSLATSGVVRGVALNPGTPVEAVEPLLDDLELILLLGVNPGYGGQTFLRSTVARTARARELAHGREIAICVDGGVTLANIAEVAALEADVVVAGSAGVDGRAPAANARALQQALRLQSTSHQ